MTAAEATAGVQALSERLSSIDVQLRRAAEEKRDTAAKLENNVNLIWDQVNYTAASPPL